MLSSNEKIGELIAHIRQERGLSQAEFARRLHTSQSAVNRIEHGRQNMSLETLGRISDVLNKQLISVTGGAVNLRIEGGQELSGEITLKTSKNAAVGLLCASLLNEGLTKFKSFPKIEEVYRVIEVLESIGVSVKWLPGNDLEVRRPKKLALDKINSVAAKKTRTVLMLIGPLVHDFSSFKIPYAGGCKLGTRTIEPHLYALEEFGVSIVATTGNYNITVKKKPAGRITLYEPGDTVTENALMAAAKCEDETIIEFASANYAIQELCLYLQKLGVKIEGIGSTTLKVKGLSSIKKNVVFSPSEDPIEAMFFVSVAVTTNSEITIRRVPIAFMSVELLKLRKMGVVIDQTERYKANNGYTDLVDLTVHKHNGSLKALTDKLHSLPYPGLNADNLPYFVPIAAIVKGRTLIHDWMYENRAIYYTELTKIGAQVELADPHRVYIYGPTKFRNADVVCPPALRPASLLLIGMLAANGVSMLRNVYTINRGYEDLAERLNQLGAKIAVIHEF
ncbi:MAG TPA: UDP-N-acetylglucosamine 1-carboxyvinyltransferase [Candidatus Saccharimonadales bacterium]